MPNTYELAPVEVTDRIVRIASEYHQTVEEAGVKIGCLMAFAPVDEETGIRKGTALKGYGGVPAGAQVKLVALKDRITKGFDVEMVIDGDMWKELPDEVKDALIDHELTHIEVDEGTDDIGRPKLKMRKEGFIIWGFPEVIRRHGKFAIESINFRSLMDQHGPLLLGKPEEKDVTPKAKPKKSKGLSVVDDGDDGDEAGD